MANTINAVAYDTMRGAPGAAAPADEALVRLGVDGVAYRLVGQRPVQVQILTTTTAANAAAADAACAAQMALRGSTVTIVDSHNTTHTHCRIRDVLPVKKAVTAVAGGNTILITTTWTVEKGPA